MIAGMAEHSVRRHLRVEIAAYDRAIRRWIPGYEAMLESAAREIGRGRPRRIVDLGAGTGALSEAILRRSPGAVIELVDVDREMLEQARVRLKRFGDRVRYREASFRDPIPECDAIAASLALHHVPTMAEKRSLFRRIHRALRPGGVFVNADITMPAEADEALKAYREWAGYLVAAGIPERRAYEHFAAWADEDTYFPRELEREAMRAAGFDAAWAWTEGPVVVAVGSKSPTTGAGGSR